MAKIKNKMLHGVDLSVLHGVDLSVGGLHCHTAVQISKKLNG
jgi:hypothetical protein